MDVMDRRYVAAEVISVKSSPAFDKTNLLTIKVPSEYVMKARFFQERGVITPLIRGWILLRKIRRIEYA